MKKPKILLIHGWNYANYTSSGCNDAWANRSKFVQALSPYFNVVTINLPGFCGQPGPERPWVIDDYVDHIDTIIGFEKPDYALGYSFGGAILLRWERRTGNRPVKVILVSPAIIRRYEHKDQSFFQRTLKRVLSERLISLLRDIYLTKIIKNPYYTNATKIMRETYRNIVSVDLRKDLMELAEPITLIYGEDDSATPVNLVQAIISNTQHKLNIIPGGGHDIANSHTVELVSLIIKELEGKNET